VGLITNDQSTGLVDTVTLGARGLPVEEITGGCFCCRFGSLVEAAARLTRQQAPDVFLAEPVGSCTDLKATVSYPLRCLYGDQFVVAPLSVLVDPDRALRILGVEPGRAFSAKVEYVYRTQLDEAELIVVNKIDRLDPARRARLVAALRERFTGADVFEVSAREGTGVDAWVERLLAGALGTGMPPDIDYDAYAEGEALLGWLNGTIRLSGHEFDGNVFLQKLAQAIQSRLAEQRIEVAHLKMTLSPDDDSGELAVVNVVAGDGQPVASHALLDALGAGELIVNLRAEGDPECLRWALLEGLAGVASDDRLRLAIDHLEHFRPARPEPTHRMTA